MMSWLPFVALWGCWVLSACGSGSFPRPVTERLSVNLDDAPADRWTPLVNHMLTTYGYEGSFKAYVDYWNTFPADTRATFTTLIADFGRYVGPEYEAEVQGMVTVLNKAGHTDVTLTVMGAVNLLYSFTTGCTSIVGKNTQGEFWAGRNLDWGFSGVSMGNLTIILDFMKGGQKAFTATTWAGFVGVLTGYVPKQWSVTANRRHGSASIEDDMKHVAQDGAKFALLLTRDLLTAGGTYQEAVQQMASKPISAPIYYIVGGTKDNEGAIISRTWNTSVQGVWEMPNGPQPWFMLETNYDHWVAPPSGDNRRMIGENAMQAVGQANFNGDTLWKVLQTPGNSKTRGTFNDETVYTSVFSVMQDTMKAWIWK